MTTTIKRYEWRGWGEQRVLEDTSMVRGHEEPHSFEVNFERRGTMITHWSQEADRLELLPTHVYADSPQHLAETLRLPEWVACYLYQETTQYAQHVARIDVSQEVPGAPCLYCRKRTEFFSGVCKWCAVDPGVPESFANTVSTKGSDLTLENMVEAQRQMRRQSHWYPDCEGCIEYGVAHCEQHGEKSRNIEAVNKALQHTADAIGYAAKAWGAWEREIGPVVQPQQWSEHSRTCSNCHGRDGYHFQSCTMPEDYKHSAVEQAPSATPRVRVYCKTESPEEGENL